MDERPVVFLDVDGVLHPLNERGFPLLAELSDLIARNEEGEKTPEVASRVCDGEFHTPCMQALQRLHASTQAHFVLTSTWRQAANDVAAVNGQLRKWDLPQLIACTGRVEGGSRAAEIAAWLADHPGTGAETRPFVILDDYPIPEKGCATSSLLQLGTHLVQTDPAVGFSEHDVDSAIAILQQPSC